MDYQLHQRVMSWLKTAGDSLIASLATDLLVEEKSHASDLVTRMDKEIEAYLSQQITDHYPEHQVLGEEGRGHAIHDLQGTIWVVDPIDGTLNFVKQGRFFGIMIGIFQNGQAQAGYIYDVINDDLYYGIVGQGVFLNDRPLQPMKIDSLASSLMVTSGPVLMRNDFNSHLLLQHCLGSRSYGCAAYELIAVIRGEAGLYLSKYLMPWDAAAGMAIFEAMGYKYSRPDGQAIDLLTGGPTLFAHPVIYDEAMKWINQEEN